MKNLKKHIAGMAALLITSSAFAQAPTNSVSTKQPAPESKSVLSNFSFIMSSNVDFKRDDTKNTHFNLFILGYQFTPIVSMSLSTAYTGPLNPKPGKEATFADPELGLDFEIPLTKEGAPTQFNLLAGTGLVMPTSEDSWNNSMLIGGNVNGGFLLTSGGWTVKQTNMFYAYSYRPSQKPAESQAEVSLATLFDEEEKAPAAPPAGPNYVYTEHRLQVIRTIVKDLTIKGDFWFYTTTPTENNTEQTGIINAILGYQFTKNIKGFTGVSSTRVLTKPDAPAFYTEQSTAYRVGLALKI